MKETIVGTTGTTVLSLLLAISGSGYGQGRQRDRQDHNPTQQNSPASQQQEDHRQIRDQQPAAQHQPERDSQQQRAQDARAPHQQQDQQRRPQEATTSNRTSPQQRESVQNSWHQRQVRNWPVEHRSWQQRGGYIGYRIPDSRFRAYFGQQHGFRVGRLPFLVVGGYPRFQYGGYWFSVVDPYPAYWSNNWYDTDDVYVAYLNGGYYLYNRRYPGVGLAISVTL